MCSIRNVSLFMGYKMNLGFDLDGVLYPWQDVVYNDYITQGKTGADFRQFWKYEVPSYSKEHQKNMMLNISYIERRVPDPAIVAMLDRLSIENDIFYITARPPELRLTTYQYLKRYSFPSPENLFLAENHSKISGIRSLDIDVMTEDSSFYASELKRYCKVFLVTTLYNDDYIDADITRVKNVLEIEKWIS
jgi:uncharacterized HAD superfamily protein